jgi:hypothetical protein
LKRLFRNNWFMGLKRQLGLVAVHKTGAAEREDLADGGGDVL